MLSTSSGRGRWCCLVFALTVQDYAPGLFPDRSRIGVASKRRIERLSAELRCFIAEEGRQGLRSCHACSHALNSIAFAVQPPGPNFRTCRAATSRNFEKMRSGYSLRHHPSTDKSCVGVPGSVSAARPRKSTRSCPRACHLHLQTLGLYAN